VEEPLAYRLTVAVLAVLRAMLVYGETATAESWRPAVPNVRRAPFFRTPPEQPEVAPYISLH
jgi:hypothetical protein